ncbi:small ubiquitin-related modifier 1-like [Chenopodium quinoa]|uniref:small ubiquitin-related modifier 1-like n=1 Tax=Chenopodium quinoa TaxID=63459 RepID=UPI000B79AB71|nr:small ubiquitin-related modifier 1-like [Chenopodium quinoa]
MAEKRKISNESIITYKHHKTSALCPSSDHYVRLKFVNQDNEETFFKVLRNANLGKAFKAYSHHHNLTHQLHFTFDGMRVNPNLTPDDLNVRDGDVFDVFSYVHGGGGAAAAAAAAAFISFNNLG